MPTLSPSMLVLADESIWQYIRQMRGPEFLGWYGLWFLAVLGITCVLRWRGGDKPALTLAGLTGYEAPGLLRIFVLSQPGMHNWGFLIIMMGIGGLVFFLRWEHFNQSGSGSGCGNSGCGGGGGGCGGGGGGCGGCGGS